MAYLPAVWVASGSGSPRTQPTPSSPAAEELRTRRRTLTLVHWVKVVHAWNLPHRLFLCFTRIAKYCLRHFVLRFSPRASSEVQENPGVLRPVFVDRVRGLRLQSPGYEIHHGGSHSLLSNTTSIDITAMIAFIHVLVSFSQIVGIFYGLVKHYHGPSQTGRFADEADRNRPSFIDMKSSNCLTSRLLGVRESFTYLAFFTSVLECNRSG